MTEEIPLGAEEMLRTMGLEPTTVPKVLNNNQVPPAIKQAAFEEIECFLIDQYLVEEVSLPEGREMSGGWIYLQISPRGYELVQSGETIEELIVAESLHAHQELMKQLEWLEIKRRRKEGPYWWKRRYGILFNDRFDPHYEQPVWWAKYRLNRKFSLRHTDNEFPRYWVEAVLDCFFKWTNFRLRLVLYIITVIAIYWFS